jgi:dTDP-4-amino-4,6-dideoxygalactose transaminase
MSEAVPWLPDIPQTSPHAFVEQHKAEILAAIVRVLDSGRYILGEEVNAFEQEFAHHFGLSHAVGVANGTDAIALALRSLGVGTGDRVATVSHTAVATVAAIEMAGASPVFLDVSPDTYTLDPASLGRTLATVPGIKAVVVVHLYGHPADVPAIIGIARKFGVSLIEDCAQALGAKVDGRCVGSMGDAASFSFYPTKNLGAFGDGGMVAASDAECARKVRALREYGWERRYISELPGVNSRLDELQAALLRVRLPYLDAGNRRRAQIAAAYDQGLAGTALVLPKTRPGATHVYHQYVVRHPDRDQLRSRLQSKGTGTNIHYPVPVHRQPGYEGRCAMDPGGLGVTETVAREVLSLPMYPELADATVERVLDAVHNSL